MSTVKHDPEIMKRAQRYFLLAQALPMALYYVGLGEEGSDPHYPATISYTIRAGLPKAAHHLFWTAGWASVARAISGRGQGVKLRCAFMFLQGCFAVVWFPLSREKWRNRIHGVAAGLYMAEHWFLMRLLAHQPHYHSLFSKSFKSFAAVLVMLRLIEKRLGVPHEAEATKGERDEKLRTVNPAMRRVMFALNVAVMLLENALFAVFTAGIA